MYMNHPFGVQPLHPLATKKSRSRKYSQNGTVASIWTQERLNKIFRVGERKVAAIWWWLSLSKEWERAKAHRKNLHFMAFLLKRLNRLSKVPTSSVYTLKTFSYSSLRLPHELFLKVNLCGSHNRGRDIFVIMILLLSFNV